MERPTVCSSDLGWFSISGLYLPAILGVQLVQRQGGNGPAGCRHL